MTNQLLIRADANTQIGSGHVMRCLALAQAWQDEGGDVLFITTNSSPTMIERVKTEGFDLASLTAMPGSAEDAVQTVKIAHKEKTTFIIVDGYHFDANYQRVIKENNLNLMLIDDYAHASQYYADIVLNQNIYAHEGMYKQREDHTKLLLGTPYALLRREFRKWRGWKREIPDVARRILITMGGGDPENVTLKVLQAFQNVEVDDLDVIVIAGVSNHHIESLKSAIKSSKFPIRLEIDTTRMAELIAWADIVISAAGSTCWELAFMGLPAIVMILTENQKYIAIGLDESGTLINLGWEHDASFDRISNLLSELISDDSNRRLMSCKGRELVDGKGAERVVKALKENSSSIRG